jgi:hypothetical protein
MFCRNVDFIAVFVIALGLLGLSNAPAQFRFPLEPIRVENINTNTQTSGCAVSDRIFSSIAYFLNQ